MTPIHLRTATVADLPQICELFRQTVLHVNKKDYSQLQVEAWAAASTDTTAWSSRIDEQHFLLATDGTHVLGFASMAMGGYLDTFYVHKDWQGKGIAKLLLAKLEQWAKDKSLVLVVTDASITAKPFFERNGYRVVNEQLRNVQGQVFVNYSMKKWL